MPANLHAGDRSGPLLTEVDADAVAPPPAPSDPAPVSLDGEAVGAAFAARARLGTRADPAHGIFRLPRSGAFC